MSEVRTERRSTAQKRPLAQYDSINSAASHSEKDKLIHSLFGVGYSGVLQGASAADTVVAQGNLLSTWCSSQGSDEQQLLQELLDSPLILHAEIVSWRPEIELYVVGTELSDAAYSHFARCLLHYEDKGHFGANGILFDEAQADKAMPGWRERKEKK